MNVPPARVRALSSAGVRSDGQYVLYWMVAVRRAHDHFGLQRAVEHATRLNLPLVILEPLRVAYPHASARLHRFVLEGMRERAELLAGTSVRYYPYVEPEAGAGRGLVAALAERAAVVVTDDWPCFFVPRMVAAAAREARCRWELVDANGLLPVHDAERVYSRAFDFRRAVTRRMADDAPERARRNPLQRLALPPARLPGHLARWPDATAALGDLDRLIASLPLPPGPSRVATEGGERAAEATLRRFVGDALARYADDRDHPDREATSNLSPYLHFGHLAPQRVVDAVARHEGWQDAPWSDGERLFPAASEAARAFLDQLVVWRELGFNWCSRRDDAASWHGVPAWARASLEAHAGDARTATYDLARLEAAETDDALWNAAQRQLLREGRIHNYLRMLWGKRVITWSRDPAQAFAWLVHLNDRWALDGRDPNSYSGIAWCFGRYDRPWPAREIFGVVRAMTSQSAAKKLRVRDYLRRFGSA